MVTFHLIVRNEPNVIVTNLIIISLPATLATCAHRVESGQSFFLLNKNRIAIIGTPQLVTCRPIFHFRRQFLSPPTTISSDFPRGNGQNETCAVRYTDTADGAALNSLITRRRASPSNCNKPLTGSPIIHPKIAMIDMQMRSSISLKTNETNGSVS